MADARTDTPHTFRTYIDATERDQLDARAACAEAVRDEAIAALRDTLAELKDRTAGLRAERVKTGRLEGDLRSQTQAVREALAERDKARETTEYCWSIVKGCAAERDAAQQLAAFRQGVIERYRQEVGAAGDVLAVVRDAAERIDRALATYDTTPGEGAEVDPDALSEPQPPDLASWGEREVIAGLRTGAAHRTLQLGAANLIERLIRERGVAPLGSPSPRAQEQPATAATGLPTGADETLAWMRRHGLGHGAGVGAVLAAVRADLARP